MSSIFIIIKKLKLPILEWSTNDLFRLTTLKSNHVRARIILYGRYNIISPHRSVLTSYELYYSIYLQTDRCFRPADNVICSASRYENNQVHTEINVQPCRSLCCKQRLVSLVTTKRFSGR